MAGTTTPSPASENLLKANMAIVTVRSKLPMGMSNDLGNLRRTRGKSISCLDDSRKKFDEVKNALSDEARVRTKAMIAVDFGCGNCEEHAFVAFVTLKRFGTKPLEIVRFRNKDHVFVVIGRLPSSNIEHPLTWGPSAVVVDAWK